VSEADDLVLVAGAGGFIGGALTAALLERGHHVRGVDSKPLDLWYQRPEGAELIAADLRQREACDQVMRGVGVVYDLAADMGGMGFIETHKAECMLSILIGTHLLLAARDAGVHRFFFSSSACVYNLEKQQDAAVTPLREADAYPAMPEDGYGWEKLFMERMCRHFSEDFGMTTRIARYHNVYGPSGTWDGGREKAPAAICRKVAEAQLSGRDAIDIWGDGEQTRSFMYIDDCVDGTKRIMESDYAQPLNLGSSELVTINQLVDIVERIGGSKKLERHYQLDAPKGVRGRNSDNSLINQVLDWEPSISLEVGLEKTYCWIHDQLVAGIKDPDRSSA
jgi:nucleoside-diphosphate-sugar epimerase